jgi:Domain of unknown function (DUF4062)
LQPKKYQIFVSSTFRDLVEERQDVIKSILDLGHIPAGMEGFPAMDMEQLKYIKKVIDQCDYYILIVAGRYGSVDADGISFTEKEYQYAVETEKTVLAFVLEDPDGLPPDKADTDPNTIMRLNAFRDHIRSGRLVRHWKDRENLKYAVITSLVAAFEEQPGLGWIRANAAASEDILSQINELRIRNDALQETNARLRDELTPKISNLASLDSTYAVEYTYTQQINQRAASRRGSVEMTWRTIFTAVGPQLVQPHLPSLISKSLDKFIVEKGIVKDKWPHLLDATENEIKIQLTALGLINNFQGQKASGGLAECVQLTDYGKRILYETMTFRETPSK